MYVLCEIERRTMEARRLKGLPLQRRMPRQNMNNILPAKAKCAHTHTHTLT